MNQYQFQAPPLSKVNKTILIATGACFILSSILKAVGAFSLLSILGLSGSGLLSGFVFQLVTYPFVEIQFMGFLFNSLLVWFIGSELENQWGSKVYVRFLLVTAITVGLIYSLISITLFFGTSLYSAPLHGLTGINFALLVAYSVLYPDRQMSLMMIFPMKSRTFCWILVGIEAYMAVFSSMATSWAHLLAMGIGYVLIRFQTQPLVRKILNPGQNNAKRQGKKGHLYVVKDEDQKPPKYWQ